MSRYLEDEKNGMEYLPIGEGLLDMAKCHQVTRLYGVWRAEIPWRTGYFCGATALSLYLTSVPTLSARALDGDFKKGQ